MSDFLEDALPYLIIAAIAGVLIALVVCLVKEEEKWQAFKVAHSCKIVAKISGSTFNTVDSKGNVGIGKTPDKTGWACDDGITYYR